MRIDTCFAGEVVNKASSALEWTEGVHAQASSRCDTISVGSAIAESDASVTAFGQPRLLWVSVEVEDDAVRKVRPRFQPQRGSIRHRERAGVCADEPVTLRWHPHIGNHASDVLGVLRLKAIGQSSSPSSVVRRGIKRRDIKAVVPQQVA